MKALLVLLSPLLGALALASCGDDDTEQPITGDEACRELSTVCHGLQRSGVLMDCHNLGHEGDGEACLEDYEECIELCEAAREEVDAGMDPPEHDSGPSAPEASPSDAEVPDGALTDGRVVDAHEAAPPEAGDGPPDVADEDLCWEISKICHELDDGTENRFKECHDIGHADETEDCIENRDCLELCWEAAN